MLHQHLGHLLGAGGVGLGATLAVLFKDIIRDSWQDYRRRRNTEPRQTPGTSADRLGAEVTHSLVALLTKDLDDHRASDDKKWEILRELVDGMKATTASLVALQQQAANQTTLLQVIAARHQ